MSISTTTVGRRLASIEEGTGPGVLMLHGNGGSTLRYRLCLPYLARSLRAVAVDMPGFGDSRHLPGERYSLKEFGEAIAAFAESHFGQPPVLLGHGVGGLIAVEAVLASPEVFRGLLLHAPLGARLNRRLLPWFFTTPLTSELLRHLIAAPGLRPLWARRFFAYPGRVPAEIQAEFFDDYLRCRSFYRFFRLLNSHWFARVGRVRLPTAILWGARDRILHVAQISDWVRAIPGTQIKIVPHWDHFPMLETPADYAATVVGLVQSLIAQR